MDSLRSQIECVMSQNKTAYRTYGYERHLEQLGGDARMIRPVAANRREKLVTGEIMSEHRRTGADFRSSSERTGRHLHAPVRPRLHATEARQSTIRSLLDAAVQAPTAMHMEPWAFVVVQDEGTLKRYSDRAKGSWAKEAAKYRDLHAGVDAEAGKAFAEDSQAPTSASSMTRHADRHLCKTDGAVRGCRLLAGGRKPDAGCSALGLGTCCIGSAIPVLNSPDIKSELGIPADVEAVAPIIVGVPSGPTSETPRRTRRSFWN